MRVATLSSGSKGNCIYIEDGDQAIVIDQGLSLKELKSRANDCEVDLGKIKAILVTHEHSDHIKGVGVLSRAIGAEVYSHDLCYQRFSGKLGNINYVGDNKFYENGFEIGRFNIKPFRTPHDAVYSLGYRVECDGKTCTVATDLGVITKGVFKHLTGSDLAIIESNHDVKMLTNGAYPEELKRRILSSNGHLSNELASKVIKELANIGTRKFLLAHLSEDNNLHTLAYQTAYEALASIGAERDIDLNIAGQYKPSKIITL